MGKNTRVTPFSTVKSGRLRLMGAALAALLVVGCQADDEVSYGTGPKHLRPVSSETKAVMVKLEMPETAPVLMRIFKEENKFEVWKQTKSGRYELLKSYDICKWSGKLGPKLKEGDRQAPEGYYNITPALMNPNSSYYLAFNTGFPNAYDRANGRTGTHLMVHGACSSRGCYAMTDEQMEEIYALARDAFRGGQKSFQLAAYPFRMTPENLARHYDDPNLPFWKMLKEGYDHFELTRQEPRVDVCGRRYVFNSTPKGPMNPSAACPVLEQPEQLRIAAAKKAEEDDAKFVVLAAKVREERRLAEEKQMLIAAEEEEQKRRAEERRLAMAARKQAVSSLFASLTGNEREEAPLQTLENLPLPTVAADGTPLPRPAPPRPDGAIMALAPAEPQPQPQRSGSMFSRLFTFGSVAPAEPRPAATEPEVVLPATAPAPGSGAPPNPSVTSSQPAAATAPRPVTPRPAPAARKQVQPAGAAPSAPETQATSCEAGRSDPACPAAAFPAGPPAQQSKAAASIVDRIGNWF